MNQHDLNCKIGRKRCVCRSRGTVFSLLCRFLSLLVIIAGFKMCVLQGGLSFVSNILSSSADALIFLLIGLLLRYMWSPLELLPIAAVTVLVFVNVMYYRNFGDVLPPSLYSPTADYFNGFVLESSVSSLRPLDILWCIPLVISVVVFCKSRNVRFTPRIIVAVSLFAIVLTAASVVLGIRRVGIYTNAGSFSEAAEEYRGSWKAQTRWSDKILHYGLTGYTANSFSTTLTSSDIALTDSEVAEITAELERFAVNRGTPICVLPDNDGKNLIFIEVESLSSKFLELPYAQRLAPTLFRLLSEAGTFHADLEVQAGPGRSSDAQFMHNTGLLPLRHEITVNGYPLANYPSIAKSLPDNYTSLELICESRGLWSHGLTNRSLGFDYLFDDLTAGCVVDQDSVLFAKAAVQLSRTPQPFYAFITTISSHDPYDETKVSVPAGLSLIIPPDVAETDRNYMLSLAHFDKALSAFIVDLNRLGIFDNSVMVITGDHEPRKSCVSELFHCAEVPFIIVNSGVDSRTLNHNHHTTQADIFPTLHDVMGLRSFINVGGKEIEWCGFGHSLLRDSAGREGKENWELSETIIRSRLFGNRKE